MPMGVPVDLNSLTDEELLGIASNNPSSERSLDLFQFTITKAGSCEILKDEAEGCYWKRQLDRTTTLSDGDFEILLSMRPFSPARNLLGEAAMCDKLSDDQLGILNTQEDDDTFVRKQVLARLLVRRISVYGTGRKGGCATFELLDQLAELGLLWPYLELCDMLDCEALDHIGETLEAFPFSRRDRHEIRTALARARRDKGIRS